MVTEIRVPALGESVSEAIVGKWNKKNGEIVKADELLVELETDKVSVDVPAPVTGRLSEIHVQEGETVKAGAVLGLITESTVSSAASTLRMEVSDAVEHLECSQKSTPLSVLSSMPPAPSATKFIAENNLNAGMIRGSGKRGQVLKEDVLKILLEKTSDGISGSSEKISYAKYDDNGEKRIRINSLRQTIARRLKDAQNTAAILTTFNEVDMSSIIGLRKRYRDLFEKKHGIKLGFMGFFTKAVCYALKEIPILNAEINGAEIIYKSYAHIGIAVSTDRGLVVPVVRNADRISIAEIEKTISYLGKFARDGELSITDMQGGTFTITNGGIYGSLMSTPILNAPQSGILGMHAIRERPVALDGQIVIRPMMYLAVSYDHRIVDGQEAVTFLIRVKESLEDPERIILDL